MSIGAMVIRAGSIWKQGESLEAPFRAGQSFRRKQDSRRHDGGTYNIQDQPEGVMRVALTSQDPIPNLADDYSPRLIEGANGFVTAVYRHSRLPPRVFEAARIATAVINGCLICRNFRVARDLAMLGLDDGLSGEGELPDEAFYERLLDNDLSLLSNRERLAVQYVRMMGTDPQGLAADEAFWTEFKAAFDDAEIVDLTYCAASWIGLGRAAHVLGTDSACSI